MEQKRELPVEVLHLGMPRTASLSMMAAYQTLGLSTYHGFDFVARPEDQIQWERAIDAKYYGKGKPFEKADFDAFLGKFQVLSDLPLLGFTEEMIAMYPNAKVVLVERDLEQWYRSFSEAVIPASYTWIVWILTNVLDPYFMRARPATLMIKLEYAMFDCNSRESFERNARATYLKHYEMVRQLVPKDRLLEYEIGSGWQPLCEFLGKDVPKEDFPHKNESKEFVLWMRKVQMRTLREALETARRTLAIPMSIGAVSYMIWKLRRFHGE